MSSSSAGGAALALYRDKSQLVSCPTPRPDRVLLLWDGTVRDIGCGRNVCPVCRRRNVRITAAMIGLTALERAEPPTHAVLSTTRDWLSDSALRETWRSFSGAVRRDLGRKVAYCWLREWTTGRRDGIRRTHYHSVWCGLTDGEGELVRERSLWAFGRSSAATSEHAHGVQRVWDAGGLARYMAGLVGHHLKSGQAPPPGWSGRRFATSRSPRFYAWDSRELRARAAAVSGRESLRFALESAIVQGSVDRLPELLVDEVVTRELELELSRPAPRVVSREYAGRVAGWSRRSAGGSSLR